MHPTWGTVVIGIFFGMFIYHHIKQWEIVFLKDANKRLEQRLSTMSPPNHQSKSSSDWLDDVGLFRKGESR